MSDLPEPPSVSWNPPVPGSSWDPEPGAAPVPPSGEIPRPSEPHTASRPRRRGVAIVGAGALVAAGVFAVTRIAGGSEGGADSPEAAIEHLVDALNHEDVLGAMDVLLPGERRTFRQPITDMVSELRRLDVLGHDADLGKVGGTDLEITIDDLQVDEVADDIADVSIDGEASIDVDPSELPIGDVIIDQLLGGDRPDGSFRQDSTFGGDTGDSVKLTTVRRDGRWYVSLFYSVAEGARGDADVPDPEDAIEPDGSASPEDAVDQMLDAATKLDLEQAIATLDPNEFEALQRYAPIFLDDAQNALDRLDGFRIDVRDTEYDVEGAGDGRAAVGFSSFRIDASADGQDVRLDWDGECMSMSGSGVDSAEGCVDDDVSLDDLDGDHVLDAVMAGAAKAFADTHPIVATKVDGEWYVSVFGSFFDAIVEALRGVDADQLKDDIGQLGDAIDQGLNGELPGGDILGGITGTDDTVPSDTGNVDDGTVGGSVPDITVPGTSALDSCYQEPDVTAASGCFDDAVAAGTIDATDVPPALRFPECGIADGWWDYRTYESMSDEEFTTLVTSAHTCFVGHVDAGELDDFAIPYEAVAPECWGGVNPYLLGDAEYSDAIEAYASCSGQ